MKTLEKPLTGIEQWMVKSNLERIENGASAKEIITTLKRNGYERVANTVEIELMKNQDQETSGEYQPVNEVILRSDEYGTEVFTYPSKSEAREGFERLMVECETNTEKDGIERELILVSDRVKFEN